MRFGPVLAFVLLASAGAAGWYWLNEAPAPTQKNPTSRSEGRRAALRRDGPVPVTVETVKRETVPVYRDGIGNVQALYTVTVRTQIDGRLTSVDFKEGQEVHKGDVLARIDPTVYKAQYDQAVAKKAQDQATLANARLDLQRYQRLAQSNAGPQQQADQQAAMVAQLEAQLKSDDAAIDNAKAYLDYTTIASPIDGRVGLRLIDPGNIVHPSDANGLVTIAQIKPIALIFTLPQRDLSVVSAALARGGVEVNVLQTGGQGVLARGQLETVDNQIDVTTGTIKLKAIFPNTDQTLWPGQFVSTRVVVDTIVDAKVVPTAAVRRGPNGTFVYVVDAEQRAVVRPVSVVMQDETRAVLGDGVDVGAQVVTVGFAQLTDGKPVTVTTSMSPPNEAMVDPGPAAPPKRGEGRRREHGKRSDGGGREKVETTGAVK